MQSGKLFIMKTKLKYRLTPATIPGFAIHPGEHLKDEIEARKMSQKKLAELMDFSINIVSEIINEKRDIAPNIAIKLESALGIDAAFWLKSQVRYNIDSMRIKMRDQLNQIRLPKKKRMLLLTSINGTE